jgi:hypothetical protein
MTSSVQLRKENRVPVNMKILSGSLPNFQAELLDLSEGGARVMMKSAPVDIQGSSLPFKTRLANQVASAFQGVARVAWVHETMEGFEAGLEWEHLTNAAVSGLKNALVGAGA